MTRRLDPEIKAMRQIVRALKLLDGEAIGRILRWLHDRHVYLPSNLPTGGGARPSPIGHRVEQQ